MSIEEATTVMTALRRRKPPVLRLDLSDALLACVGEEPRNFEQICIAVQHIGGGLLGITDVRKALADLVADGNLVCDGTKWRAC